MKTPRRRDSGVSLDRSINFNNPPLPPFSKVGLEETPQQRLWGIENLIKTPAQASCSTLFFSAPGAGDRDLLLQVYALSGTG